MYLVFEAGVLDGVTDGSGELVDAGVLDGLTGGVGAGVLDGLTGGVGAGVLDGLTGGVGGGVLGGVTDRVTVIGGVPGGVPGGVTDRVTVIGGVPGGVTDCVTVIGGVPGGVTDGVLVGVWLGSVEQSVTVLIVPDASNVTTYLLLPSIINENPPGLDVYVLVNNVESLYITKPFVIAKFLSIYFVKPLLRLQAAYWSSCGFDSIIVL